jgi:hypothetical protein
MEDSVAQEINTLRLLFFEKESELQNKKDSATTKIILQNISNYRPVNQRDTTSFQDNYYDAKAALLRKEWGLSGRADILQNLNPTFSDADDQILYKRRYQVGVEWDILKDGFLDKRLELKGIPSQKAYYQYLENYKNSKMDFGPKMNECLYFFNAKKIKLLDQREILLNQQLKSAFKLFNLKKITRENVLQIQTRIAETQGMRNIYESYNINLAPGNDSLFYENEAPLFDLNYSYFFDRLATGLAADSVFEMLKESSESQRKWYNDVGLKAYSRYSYYDLIKVPNKRAFFSIGLTATVPILFTTKEQKAVDQANLLRRQYDLQKQQTDKRLEVLNEAYEFRYHLKQYVIFHQKKILQLEALRRERVKSKLLDADFNPQKGIELLDNILQIDIEMLDLKQNLYLRLLRIHDKQSEVEIKNMIIPMALPNFEDIEDKITRGMYVWSKAFSEENTKFIEEYLIYNNVDRIYLAVQENDSNLVQKNNLSKELKSHNIAIELLIGKNKLIDSKNIAKDIQQLTSGFKQSNYSGIHLDIEPHTMEGYKENKVEMLQKLITRAKEMRTYCDSNKLTLSMDIPLHYGDTVINELISIVDRVHFMCYENVKPEYLIRKLNLYSKMQSKVSFALRTEDFLNRAEIEKLAQQISSATNITNIDFHDFNRFVKFDKESLRPDAKY